MHFELSLCLCANWLHGVSADDASSKDSSSWYETFVSYVFNNKCCQTWILSIFASCVVGLSGVVPLIFIPFDSGAKFNQEGGSKYLRLLLSFAVGGLLGDVFLHLLPEAWNQVETVESELHSGHLTLGLWVLLGMFSFVILEIMFAASQQQKAAPSSHANGVKPVHVEKSKNALNCNGDSVYHEAPVIKTALNGSAKHLTNGSTPKDSMEVMQPIHISGYLNLMANGIDNFTHGLAVGGSFIVGAKMGVLTTFAILIHEIPHEIGDFAILLKSGFNPWNAAKAQISTAIIGVLGAVVALSTESTRLGSCTSWILPFTSGGFLNIALVNVLPDLLKEKDPWESIKQMICLCGGIGVMALVNILIH